MLFIDAPLPPSSNGVRPSGRAGRCGPLKGDLWPGFPRAQDFLFESGRRTAKACFNRSWKTCFGIGLDPHITSENARLQADRVAKARSLTVDPVRDLIQQNTDPADLGILGEPGVNVLRLNLALDAIATGEHRTAMAG